MADWPARIVVRKAGKHGIEQILRVIDNGSKVSCQGFRRGLAISLYRKFGYEEVGERRKQWGKGTVLVKRITTALH